jgi:glycosyltransferase involved in cell wall biosynthesis
VRGRPLDADDRKPLNDRKLLSDRINVLTIGHSYVVAENRALVREVARDVQLDVTVAAPVVFRSGLGRIELQPEPPDSNLKLKALTARFTQWTQIFAYDTRGLRMLIGSGEFDVVHAWEEPYIYGGYQIARAMSKSDAAFCFRTAQNIDKRYPFPFSHFERTAINRAQGWIAGGKLVFESRVRCGYPGEKGRIITLAVDLNAFKPLAPDRKQTVARELGLVPPIIAYVGRLTRAKGIDLMMRAMDAVGSATPWSLLVMGAGPMETELRNWAASRGWSDRVQIRLVPHRDVPAYLGAADVLIAPSQTGPRWREQFGRMVIEAFACGVPVLGSDSGEIPYVIADSGRSLPENDSEAWAKAIIEVLGSAELRADMARRGLQRVQAYSVAAVAEQYRSYYRDLADRRRLAA